MLLKNSGSDSDGPNEVAVTHLWSEVIELTKLSTVVNAFS